MPRLRASSVIRALSNTWSTTSCGGRTSSAPAAWSSLRYEETGSVVRSVIGSTTAASPPISHISASMKPAEAVLGEGYLKDRLANRDHPALDQASLAPTITS